MAVDRNVSADSDDTELDGMAFELFKEATRGRAASEQMVLSSYRSARTFLETRVKIHAGAVDIAKPTGPQLSECSAPNLDETHPHNVVSQRFGDLKEVERIYKLLERDPMATEFKQGQYKWDKDQVALARNIFPYYIKQAA